MLASCYGIAFEHVSSHQLCGYLYKNRANQNFKIMEGEGVLDLPAMPLPIGEVTGN